MSEVLKPSVYKVLSCLWIMLPVNWLCFGINEVYSLTWFPPWFRTDGGLRLFFCLAVTLARFTFCRYSSVMTSCTPPVLSRPLAGDPFQFPCQSSVLSSTKPSRLPRCLSPKLLPLHMGCQNTTEIAVFHPPTTTLTVSVFNVVASLPSNVLR